VSRAGEGRGRRVVGGLLLGAVLTATVSACGSAEPASPANARTSAAPTNVPADASTRRVAEVEFVRQCTIADQSFPKESDLDADLDRRLASAGISHLQWKDWHDALVTSPQLVSQLAEVGTGGCPKG
jgi:hypothetical protein